MRGSPDTADGFAHRPPGRTSARGRAVAIAAIMVNVGVIAVYLSVITSQSDNDMGRVAIAVLYFSLPIVGLVGALTLDSPSARGVVGAGAAGLLLSMGVLSLPSIGLLVLIAAALAIAWVVRSQPERGGSSPLPTLAAFVVGAILPWSLLLMA
jgi:hypothetical protein